MTPFRWVLLCIFFTLYLLLGGSIFMLIEQHHEIHQKEELHVLRQDIQEILFRLDHNFYSNVTSPDVLEALTSAKEGVINRIAAVCGIDNLLDDTGAPEPTSLKWNYYNSVFFAFTVVTTIGYGHLSPSTSLSKSLMMVYALFGIPLNGILLSGVGDYFSNKLVKVHQKSKDKQYRGKSFTLVFEIIFYLIPGIIVFIIIPAGIFVLIENWTFLDSVYFAFVSLTTIGFGDYVAGMGDGHNFWLWLYKAFIIIWITFGLGYLIMILGFIAKGMKSKKVRGVLEKRLTGIRNTKEKLAKDIEYMRRVVNELYLMKLKPTYDVQGNVEENNKTTNGNFLDFRIRRPSCVQFERRCSSLPRLPIYVNGEPQLPGGRPYLLNSESLSQCLRRRLSESDLSCINHDEALARFNEYTRREELLASVVDALSGNVMKNVMDAVDELNKYEQQVEDERDFGPSESPNDSGDDQQRRDSCDSASDASTISDHATHTENVTTAPPWELGALSESDEEELLEDKPKPEQLECIVVHKSGVIEGDKKVSQSQSIIDKMNDAIRKISGTMTPPETPSRKISRNESEKKRKISRSELEKVGSTGGMRNPHGQSQFSPFIRRPSGRRQHPLHHETETKHYTKNSKAHGGDSRKISQESRISNVSTASYHTIDEIMSSVRTSRRPTPAHYHPSTPLHPPTSGVDQIDSSLSSEHGRSSLEASTSSLANFLKALDNVQDRLHKSSVGSEASYSGSYLSSRSEAIDLSNSFAPNSASKQGGSRYKRIPFMSPLSPSVDRKRKVGVFQPGFSYVNFGYNPEEEDDEDVIKNIMMVHKKLPDPKDVDSSKCDNANNNNNNNTISKEER